MVGEDFVCQIKNEDFMDLTALFLQFNSSLIMLYSFKCYVCVFAHYTT